MSETGYFNQRGEPIPKLNKEDMIRIVSDILPYISVNYAMGNKGFNEKLPDETQALLINLMEIYDLKDKESG